MKKIVLIVVILSLSTISFAETLKVEKYFEGIKTANVIFDVNVNDPSLLLFRLKLINRTVDDLEKYGVRGDVIVSIRGRGSLFVTRGTKYVDPEKIEIKKLVRDEIKVLKKKNIQIVQCGIATKVLGINNDDILEEIDVVENSFAVLIAYQVRGYAFVDTMFGR